MATKCSTRSIGPKQAARAFHAVRFANDNGQPLNLMVTIDFTSLGLTEERATGFFRDVWARYSRWYAYQRGKGREFGSFDAYAVHENPPGGPRHVHWIMRVPDGARDEAEKIIRKRIEKLTGLACLGAAVHFLELTRAGGVTKYVLKGINPLFAGHFYMEACDQGEVTGRRITISRSIGFSARQKAGWKRK